MNLYDLLISKKLKIGKKFEQILHKSGYTNGRFTEEKMFKSVTRKKQIKITIRYQYTPTRMVKILKTDHI